MLLFRDTPITEFKKTFCLQKADENEAFAILYIPIHQPKTCCNWTVYFSLVDFPEGRTWFTTRTLRLDNPLHKFLRVISQKVIKCEIRRWLKQEPIGMLQRGRNTAGGFYSLIPIDRATVKKPLVACEEITRKISLYTCKKSNFVFGLKEWQTAYNSAHFIWFRAIPSKHFLAWIGHVMFA